MHYIVHLNFLQPLTEVDNPGEFGVAELSEDGNVKRLVEKPKKPPLNLALVGIYFFNHHTYDAVKNIKPSWRNELKITDAIQWLIDKGYNVTASVVSGWWKDTGKPEDILHANRLILDDLTSEIKGPALIGRNCVIKDSYIAFYTSIGNNCKIINSEVEDSVLMEGARIIDAGDIVDSIIGRDVIIEKNNKLPKGNKFIIGDNALVRI
jgi:glucose-1-phosphate thymidylyltransferase